MTADEVLGRLAAATQATVTVRSGGAGTEGQGAGHALATRDGTAVTVSEAGTWTYGDARPMRWRAASTWCRDGEALAVEHLRQGTPAAAVLDRQPDGRWVGRAPHHCGADRYHAEVEATADEVVVTWTISGPCKAAQIVTRYR